MIGEAVDRVAVQAAVLDALRALAHRDVVWPETPLRELGLEHAASTELAVALSRDLARRVAPESVASATSAAALIDALADGDQPA